ncbi:MAG: adenine nucleotide alpha hydrolase [Planctomycetia bacterium]|nr:adenine nucleotide alpha hydrolase [Planctomycetia bacterium]
MREKAIVFWSGGKDCAFALYEVRREFEIVALLTTVTADYDRISMHGVRRTLLEKQATALGYPLQTIEISIGCGNDEYERKTRAALDEHVARGVTVAICGDLFLEEVRKYREERLFPPGMRGVFPLWGRPTPHLAREFIGLGFRAVLCCVDTHVLHESFAGRDYDERLLTELPAEIDPCGENGEFHTFVVDGPNFAAPVPCEVGMRTLRDARFCFCDLAGPADDAP